MLSTDQMNRSIELNQTPKRIVSLVPSQTELLHDLGLDQELVGITKFCIHPKQWCGSKTKIGGTKDFKIEQILALKPDLIIANKEENEEGKLKELMKKFPVWVSDIHHLEDAIDMIHSIGAITAKKEKASEIAKKITTNFKRLNPLAKRLKSLYLIWHNPSMSVNHSTFISNMMEKCGFENIANTSIEYPALNAEDIQALKPELILLSSEPFPFKEKHIKIYQQQNPQAKVLLVDGEAFSWYGSRLINSPEYFISLKRTI